MNPPDEPPEARVNGQTSSIVGPGPQAPKGPGRGAPRKPAAELLAFERRNWLIHQHYVRKEFDICKVIIKSQLEETQGMCDYANYIQGLILRQEGRIQEALEMFQICNILNPSSSVHVKQMARCLCLLGRHKLAVEAYKQAEARQLGPGRDGGGAQEQGDWEIHHNLGVCHVYLKQVDLAVEELEKALQLHKHDQTFLTLGKVHLQVGNIQAALQVYKQGVAAFPENPDLRTNLGLLYMQTGEPQMAFEQFGTAMSFAPNHPRALMAAGSMMQSHHDYDVALSKYTSTAQVTPESPNLWNNIGMCFFGKKKYVASISCLKRANYLAPFDWKILYNLGLVHLTMQQFASAFIFLSASINLRPTRGQTFGLLAVALTYLNDPENALSAYEQALQLDQVDPAVVLNYAIFVYNQGKQDEAVEKMHLFEIRVDALRQTPPGLDADPDVLAAAKAFCSQIGHVLRISLPQLGSKSPEALSEVTKTGQSRRHHMPSASVKEAKANYKRQVKADSSSSTLDDEVVDADHREGE